MIFMTEKSTVKFGELEPGIVFEHEGEYAVVINEPIYDTTKEGEDLVFYQAYYIFTGRPFMEGYVSSEVKYNTEVEVPVRVQVVAEYVEGEV